MHWKIMKADIADVEKGWWVVVDSTAGRGGKGKGKAAGQRTLLVASQEDAQVVAAQARQSERKKLSLTQAGLAAEKRPVVLHTLYNVTDAMLQRMGANTKAARQCWDEVRADPKRKTPRTSDGSGKRAAAAAAPPPHTPAKRKATPGADKDPVAMEWLSRERWQDILVTSEAVALMGGAAGGRIRDGEFSGESFKPSATDDDEISVGPQLLASDQYLVWIESEAALQLLPSTILKVAVAGQAAARTEAHPWKKGQVFQVDREAYPRLTEICVLMRLPTTGGDESVLTYAVHAGVLLGLARAAKVRMRSVPEEAEDLDQSTCRRVAVHLDARLDEWAQVSKRATGKALLALDESSPRRMASQLSAVAAEVATPSSGGKSSGGRGVTPTSGETALAAAAADQRQLAAPSPGREVHFCEPASVTLMSKLPSGQKPAFCERAVELAELDVRGTQNRRTVELVSAELDEKFAGGAITCVQAPADGTVDAAIAALGRALRQLRKRPVAQKLIEAAPARHEQMQMFVSSAGASGAEAELTDEQLAEMRLLRSISENNAAQEKLNEMVVAGAVADWEKLRTVQKAPESAELTRLFAMASTIAGTQYAVRYQEVVRKVAEVRVALDKMAAPPVLDALGHASRQRSAKYRAQSKYIRTGKWTKLRPAFLVGKVDATAAGAWAFLDSPKHAAGQDGLEGDEHDLDSGSLFTAMLAEIRDLRLQYRPDDDKANAFFEALRATAVKARARGKLSYAKVGFKLWMPLAARMELAETSHAHEGTARLCLDKAVLLATTAPEVVSLEDAVRQATLLNMASKPGVRKQREREEAEEDPKGGKGAFKKQRPGGKTPRRTDQAAAAVDDDGAEEEVEAAPAPAPARKPTHKEKKTKVRVKDTTLWVGKPGAVASMKELSEKIDCDGRPCRFFYSKGGCLRADDCPFAHAGAQEKASE